MNNYKSWMDKARITSAAESLAEILKHEQGHYNIAYLEQQEVIRSMNAHALVQTTATRRWIYLTV
jgi:hypothetical protein